ncbi:polyketide synthase dehydratase domain-containing protein [Streptomyces sp. PmtG]
MATAGLWSADHPLLGAAVTLADEEGALLTGRLSLATHPWLADHTVGGVVLVPGAAFVELAIRAGDQVGLDHVEELTLAAPLVLPEDGAVRLQVSVGAPDASGRRTLTCHARPDGAPDDEPWTRHAFGTLTAGEDAPAADGEAWPPAGAERIDVDGRYDDLAASGLGYGPAFRGLRAAWRRGDEVFVEVELPDENTTTPTATAASFALHPALLDSVLHAIGLGGFVADTERLHLPYSWRGVRLAHRRRDRAARPPLPGGRRGCRARPERRHGRPRRHHRGPLPAAPDAGRPDRRPPGLAVPGRLGTRAARPLRHGPLGGPRRRPRQHGHLRTGARVRGPGRAGRRPGPRPGVRARPRDRDPRAGHTPGAGSRTALARRRAVRRGAAGVRHQRRRGGGPRRGRPRPGRRTGVGPGPRGTVRAPRPVRPRRRRPARGRTPRAARRRRDRRAPTGPARRRTARAPAGPGPPGGGRGAGLRRRRRPGDRRERHARRPGRPPPRRTARRTGPGPGQQARPRRRAARGVGCLGCGGRRGRL